MGLTEEGSNSVLLAPVPSTKGVVELGRTEVTEVWMSWLFEVSFRISSMNEVGGEKGWLKVEEGMGFELYVEAIVADAMAGEPCLPLR